MTNLELMNILTNVRGEYILQAQELRSGNRKQPLHRLHRKHVFLIAAVISLLLLLVGCAAVLIGLQKITLGRVTFPQYSQPGWTMDLVSTNGYLDSVNYQATREWIDFITSYDTDRTLEQQKDSSGYTAPEVTASTTVIRCKCRIRWTNSAKNMRLSLRDRFTSPGSQNRFFPQLVFLP